MEEFHTWVQMIIGAIGSFITAALGVLMKQAHRIQRGEPSNWNVFWLNIPTIFVMGLGGHAAGDYLHHHYGAPELLGSFLSAWLGYLGPEAVQKLIERYAEKKDGEE